MIGFQKVSKLFAHRGVLQTRDFVHKGASALFDKKFFTMRPFILPIPLDPFGRYSVAQSRWPPGEVVFRA